MDARGRRPRASASRSTCATRAGPAEQTTTSPPCFSLQAQRFLERVGVRLVHLEAGVLLADPRLGLVEPRLPLARGDLFDADGDLHDTWSTGLQLEIADEASSDLGLTMHSLDPARIS